MGAAKSEVTAALNIVLSSCLMDLIRGPVTRETLKEHERRVAQLKRKFPDLSREDAQALQEYITELKAAVR